MLTTTIRKVDEIGRVVLPQDARRAYSFTSGTEIAITTDEENKTMTVLPLGDFYESATIDDLGRITLPPKSLDLVKWNERDSLQLSFDTDTCAIFIKQIPNDTK